MSTDDTTVHPTPDTPDSPDPGADPRATASAPASGPAPAPPVYRSGPAPLAVFLGVAGLLLAVGVLVGELADVTIPWSGLGPWMVVGSGLLVVLVGLLGLRANRRQD
ncbi:hypothetical protein [uncultured Phycicoccus sp.]|uniref:hypothetical protein n=1 Tax=uncultured Phycicoccus sp. TaxID=661422 RepID=UPI00263388E9|nr:hypothetical protein [uncultured Phycicoccus sp.]